MTSLPTARTDEQLLASYAESREEDLRAVLVERYLPLARSIARRYARGAEPLDDLVQVASLGLLKALDRFDPARGVAFSSFAVPTIAGELRRHFRDRGWAVRPPRDLQERALAVERTSEELTNRLGRSPTVRELGQALELCDEDVLEAMEAATAYEATSLDAPRPGDDNDDGWSWGDSVAVEEHGYDLVEIGETLRGTLEALPDRERMILRLRFQHDMTQAEIAERGGVSQMHVSRLLRRSLDRLAAASEVFAEAA